MNDTLTRRRIEGPLPAPITLGSEFQLKVVQAR